MSNLEKFLIYCFYSNFDDIENRTDHIYLPNKLIKAGRSSSDLSFSFLSTFLSNNKIKAKKKGLDEKFIKKIMIAIQNETKSS